MNHQLQYVFIRRPLRLALERKISSDGGKRCESPSWLCRPDIGPGHRLPLYNRRSRRSVPALAPDRCRQLPAWPFRTSSCAVARRPRTIRNFAGRPFPLERRLLDVRQVHLGYRAFFAGNGQGFQVPPVSPGPKAPNGSATKPPARWPNSR
jgi:hypothetical protein